MPQLPTIVAMLRSASLHTRARAVVIVAVGAAALTLSAACAAPPRATAPKVTAPAGPVERSMVFPVAGRVSYSDTFGAPRSGGRSHEGQDLMGVRHTPLVAAADGTVTSLTWSTTGLSGNSLTITDADGWRYVYIHLNNDAPGTDDGSNVYDRAFADGIAKGQKVKAGEVVGYLGDSGNAESTSPHLHFELRRPDGSVVNAYSSLRAARTLVRTTAEQVADSPIGSLDAVSGGGGTVSVNGWTLDAHLDTSTKVSVYVAGNPVATATASAVRPDVAGAYGRGAAHGYAISAVAAPSGAQVCVVAHSIGGGGSTRVGCATAP